MISTSYMPQLLDKNSDNIHFILHIVTQIKLKIFSGSDIIIVKMGNKGVGN